MNNNLTKAVIIAGIFFVVGQYVVSAPQRTEQEVAANREITVTGTGEASARPDIALISFGLTTGPQASAAQALDILSQQFAKVNDMLQQHNIADEDITTSSFRLNPIRNYRDDAFSITGYEASETVEVKVRNLEITGQVIAAVTSQGINQIGGLSFEINVPNELKIKAQENAIANAQIEARRLAKALGARLGEVKVFSSQDSNSPFPYYAHAELAAADAEGVTAPTIPTGSYDISTTVTVTYSLE